MLNKSPIQIMFYSWNNYMINYEKLKELYEICEFFFIYMQDNLFLHKIIHTLIIPLYLLLKTSQYFESFEKWVKIKFFKMKVKKTPPNTF